MKRNFYIIVFFFIFIKINIFSQIKTGIVNYEVSTTNETFIERLKNNEKIPKDQKKYMINTLKNSKSINYKLHFNKINSIFFYENQLDIDGVSGFNYVAATFGKSTYFTNFKTKKTLKDSKYLEGKLIEQPIYKWNITTETKKIGNYVCFKATTIQKTGRDGKVRKTNIVVWFTPDIPIGFGPKNYNGLPGLVIEANIGQITIRATKIELNPKNDKLKINTPKGKIITHKESELIFKEMLANQKEMN